MWKEFGITVSPKSPHVYEIAHPLDPSRKLSFMPDVPHLIKNVASAFISGQVFTFEERHISIRPVEQLARYQENLELKVAPSKAPSIACE